MRVRCALEPYRPTAHHVSPACVSGVHFAYSDFVVTAGFNQTSSHGGPIHEGLLLRIAYTGSADDATIVKLDIACTQQTQATANQTILEFPAWHLV